MKNQVADRWRVAKIYLGLGPASAYDSKRSKMRSVAEAILSIVVVVYLYFGAGTSMRRTLVVVLLLSTAVAAIQRLMSWLRRKNST